MGPGNTCTSEGARGILFPKLPEMRRSTVFNPTLLTPYGPEALKYRKIFHYVLPVEKLTAGFLFRLGSAWVGVHYSKEKRRLCINLLPFCTIWIAFKGGYRP